MKQMKFLADYVFGRMKKYQDQDLEFGHGFYILIGIIIDFDVK